MLSLNRYCADQSALHPDFKVHLLTLALCTLLTPISFQVVAQEQNVSEARLETLSIRAYRPAQTIGAATKTETPLLETPQSVSVVTRDEMDARGVQNLNEATRYNAGVLAEPQGIDNRVDDLYIRGFDSGSWGNNVTLDGMRAPSDSSDSWNRTSFNTWNLERVEVLKGPSSVLYGQLAPGGVVNQVSKTPTLNQEQQVRLELDAHGRYQTAFDLGSALEDRSALWRVVGLYSDGDTQLDRVDYEHWFLAPSVTFRLDGDRTRLTLLSLFQQDQGGSTFQFLPYEGSVVPGAEGYIDNTTFLGEPSWNVYDRTIWTAGWLFEHAFNERWKISQNARFTHVDSLYRSTVTYGVRGSSVTDPVLINGRTLPRRALQGEGSSDAWTLDTRLVGQFETGSLQHQLLVGLDGQRTEWDFLRKMAQVNQNSIAIDVYNPVYTDFDFASVLVDQVSTQQTDQQIGAYLQDQIAWGAWRLTLGGRYDWAEMDSLNRLTQVHTETDPRQFSGRAGLVYLFDNGLSPYLSYAESFQPALGSTRDGNQFDPVLGRQLEVGVKYEPKAVDGMVTLSAYELTQKNVLTADPLNEPGESFRVQTGEVRVRGVELEGRVMPWDGLSVIGAVTWMDSEVTRNNDGHRGNHMIRTPEWMGSLWLDYTFYAGALDGLSLAAGMRYVDDTYGDLANNLAIPSYQLFDAALRYDAGWLRDTTRLQLALNASNLTDQRYVATCTAVSSCYYGTGRTLSASAQLSW